MQQKKLRFLFSFLVAICIGASTFFGQAKDAKVRTWEDNLFEENVDYGSFACESKDTSIVSQFFKDHPLKRFLSVCHNNCAILRKFPQRPLPFDPKIVGNGSIAIHVLVNESGEPIYARAVNGHKVIRSILQQRACEAIFARSEMKRQRVIFACPTESCTETQPDQ